MKTYALYKGDTFIDLGSKSYLAKLLNVKESTIEFYTSPVWRRRHKHEAEGIIIIKI